jgi:hypothetical protein
MSKGSDARIYRLAGGAFGGFQRRAKRCLAGAVLFACTCLLAVSSSIGMASSPALQSVLVLLSRISRHKRPCIAT